MSTNGHDKVYRSVFARGRYLLRARRHRNGHGDVEPTAGQRAAKPEYRARPESDYHSVALANPPAKPKPDGKPLVVRPVYFLPGQPPPRTISYLDPDPLDGFDSRAEADPGAFGAADSSADARSFSRAFALAKSFRSAFASAVAFAFAHAFSFFLAVAKSFAFAFAFAIAFTRSIVRQRPR